MTGTVMVGFAETMSSMQVYCKAEHLSKWHNVSVQARGNGTHSPAGCVCDTAIGVAAGFDAACSVGLCLRHHTAATSFSTL